MKFRVLLVQRYAEVVGAIECEPIWCGAMNFMVDGKPQAALFETWFIDPGTNEPIIPSHGHDAYVVSTRLERFLILQDPALVGKLPGWIRQPPKRIIDLG